MSNYKSKEVNLGSLARYHSAYYRELCIINASSDNIVVVDVEGNKTIIEPVGSVFNNQTIILNQRETMQNSAAFNGASIPLPGRTVEVPYFKLQSGPVYVEEFNLVVCTENDSDTCRHPRQAMDYTEALHSGLQMVCDKLCDAPGIRLLANDPTGHCDTLYTLLNTQVITIPVTHLPDEVFTFSTIIINNGKYHAESTNVAALLDGTTNTIDFDNTIIPFVTTSLANAETTAKSFRWLNPKTFADYQAKVKKEQEEALAQRDALYNALKADRDAKVKELNSKLTIVNTTLAQVQAERDDFKYKYQHLKGDLSATSDMMSAYRDQDKFRTDLVLANNDRVMSYTKMHHQKDEATFKTWQMVTAAAVPSIIAILAALFRSK